MLHNRRPRDNHILTVNYTDVVLNLITRWENNQTQTLAIKHIASRPDSKHPVNTERDGWSQG